MVHQEHLSPAAPPGPTPHAASLPLAGPNLTRAWEVLSSRPALEELKQQADVYRTRDLPTALALLALVHLMEASRLVPADAGPVQRETGPADAPPDVRMPSQDAVAPLLTSLDARAGTAVQDHELASFTYSIWTDLLGEAVARMEQELGQQAVAAMRHDELRAILSTYVFANQPVPFHHRVHTLVHTYAQGVAQGFLEAMQMQVGLLGPPGSIPPATSPQLFADGKVTPMLTAPVVWGGSDVLTRPDALRWIPDEEGNLTYLREFRGGKSRVLFWITDHPEDQYPETLASAAALTVLEAFDMRAACMHLIYAAYAATLDKPWEEEFVITDQHIAAYLGLEKRKDLTHQQKLSLIASLAWQPAQILVYVGWHDQGRIGAFAIERSRLWDVAVRWYGQTDLFGATPGTQLIIRGTAGKWSKHFANKHGQKDGIAFYQYGFLPKDLLATVMRCWQKHGGAARLLIWLLFKTKVGRGQPITVPEMLEIAYGREKLDAACRNLRACTGTEQAELRRLRNSLANAWDNDLLILHDTGWRVGFDAATYPQDIRPYWAGRGDRDRPHGYWEQLINGRVILHPPKEVEKRLVAAEAKSAGAGRPLPKQAAAASTPLTPEAIRTAREAMGWSQKDLADVLGKSRAWVTLIERGKRRITSKDLPRLARVLASCHPRTPR